MKVNVKLFAEARDIAGAGDVKLDFDKEQVTVMDALESLISILGEKIESIIKITDCGDSLVMKSGYKILVNKEILNDSINAKSIQLKDGDMIGLLPPFSGG
ncbi:MAG: MoaD/ThiS family protein [Promethearchaeota archaeon]